VKNIKYNAFDPARVQDKFRCISCIRKNFRHSFFFRGLDHQLILGTKVYRGNYCHSLPCLFFESHYNVFIDNQFSHLYLL